MSEWEETDLIKIGNLISGGTPSTANPNYWDGEILFVTPFDLSRNKSAFIVNTERKITKEGLANSSANLLPAGSVILSSRAPIGYIAISKKEFTTNQGCKSVVPYSDFDSLYLYYCFNHYVERIKKLGAGSTFAEISKSDLGLVKFPHPKEIIEQRQIACIISTADAVIEKTQATISKYKAIKKGMLHDLFTRGIDLNTGKLRPKYENAPELYKESKLGMVPRDWEEGKFIDFADENISHSFTGGPFGSDLQTKHYTNTGVRIIQLQNIGDGVFNDEYKIYTSEDKANQLLNCNIYYGEIIISKMADPIARACLIPNTEKRYLMASDGIRLSIDKKKFNTRFVMETINHNKFRTIAELKATGSTRARIGLTELREITVVYPDKKEQDAIGLILDTIENKLHAEQKYLLKLKRVKAGLMSDLLSGRKRVTEPEAVLAQTEN